MADAKKNENSGWSSALTNMTKQWLQRQMSCLHYVLSLIGTLTCCRCHIECLQSITTWGKEGELAVNNDSWHIYFFVCWEREKERKWQRENDREREWDRMSEKEREQDRVRERKRGRQERKKERGRAATASPSLCVVNLVLHLEEKRDKRRRLQERTDTLRETERLLEPAGSPLID